MKICDVCRRRGTYEQAQHVVSVDVHSNDLCAKHYQHMLDWFANPVGEVGDENPAKEPPPARPGKLRELLRR